ncbi:MAG: hypothetical protein NTV09_03200 [Bacteroidetes bacterium]|nr:hypothetical protein [Bacteroidota bacterium]
MKKILLEISALLVFITLTFLLLEYLFRDYNNAVDKVMDDFFETKMNAEVLLVGNSHTLPLYHCLKPEKNANVACLTIGGDDLFWMQALVKRQLHEMPTVNYVILNCDDELLGFNQSLSGLKYMNRVLYPYTDTMYENNALDKLLSRSNFFRSNRDIGFLFNKQPVEQVTMTGFGRAIGFTDEECKSRAWEISEKRFSRKLFRENLSYLKSIISETKKCNKKLFILKMPKCECLQASVVKDNLESSRVLLDSLFSAERIDVLDFSGETTYGRDEFINPDHLTTPAAIKLIAQINEKIFALQGIMPIRSSQIKSK